MRNGRPAARLSCTSWRCSNYTTFPEFGKNTVMKDCAAKVGLDWSALNGCGTGPLGQQLMEESSKVSNARKITYGADGA